MNHVMTNEHMEQIKNIELAPFIQIAFGLIDKPRKCGGNSFRHSLNTLNVLIDYGYYNSSLLKAAVIHDVLEDYEEFDEDKILALDEGEAVLFLVKEVSRLKGEKKEVFLTRIKKTGSSGAKIIKVADRIDNVISLGQVNNLSFVIRYIKETEDYIYPIASEINENMLEELEDLIFARKQILHKLIGE